MMIKITKLLLLLLLLVQVTTTSARITSVDRSIYEYSVEELSKTGDEWQKFCEQERSLLSARKEKFTVFKKKSKLSNDNFSDNTSSLKLGGLILKLPISLSGYLVDLKSRDENGFRVFVKNPNNHTFLKLSRGKVSELKTLWGNKSRETGTSKDKNTVANKLLRQMYPDGKVTNVTLITDTYSSTPSDIKCLASSEDSDKRLLISLGIKGVAGDQTNIFDLEPLYGYADIQKPFQGNIAISIEFEFNNARYTLVYAPAVGTSNYEEMEQIIANISYVPNLASYRKSVESELDSILESVK